MRAGYTSGSDFPVGTTKIKYSYTDPSGNGPVADSFNIELRDTIRPGIQCISDTVFVSPGLNFNINSASYDPLVSEVCVYSLSQDYNGAATLNGISLNSGIHAITWTATDASGNTRTCVQVLVITSYSIHYTKLYE